MPRTSRKYIVTTSDDKICTFGHKHTTLTLQEARTLYTELKQSYPTVDYVICEVRAISTRLLQTKD